MTDEIAERARKIGGQTLRSIGDIARHQRIEDNDEESLAPENMLSELRADNQKLTQYLRQTHELCETYNDVATASLIENWIDQTERRSWFLSENNRAAPRPLTTHRPPSGAGGHSELRSSLRVL